MKAFPELQRSLQQHNSFDAGLVLHSWMGPQHLVAPLARIPGVYFSLSGHSLRSDKKAAAMVKQVPGPSHAHLHSRSHQDTLGRRREGARDVEGEGVWGAGGARRGDTHTIMYALDGVPTHMLAKS